MDVVRLSRFIFVTVTIVTTVLAGTSVHIKLRTTRPGEVRVFDSDGQGYGRATP